MNKLHKIKCSSSSSSSSYYCYCRILKEEEACRSEAAASQNSTSIFFILTRGLLYDYIANLCRSLRVYPQFICVSTPADKRS